MSTAVSDVPPSVLQMKHGALTYAAIGAGVPVVAFHGLPGSVRDFRRLGEGLPRDQVRFIRVNLPGFAGSAPLRSEGDWGELVDTAASAARELAGGPFVVLGHSFGGLVALRVAARCADAIGLALLAPAGLRVHAMVRKLGPRAGLRALRLTSVGKELFYRGLAQTGMGANTNRAESDQALALLSTLSYGPSREAVSLVKAPVFCASCRDDKVVEQEVVDELLASLNVQKRLTFDRGGHSPQRDHAPELAQAIAEFALSVHEGR